MAQTPPPTGKKPVAKPAGNPYANIQVAPRVAPKVNLMRPPEPPTLPLNAFDAFDAKFSQDLNRQDAGKKMTPKRKNFERMAQDKNRTDLVKQRKWEALTLKDNLPEIIMGGVPKRFGGGGKELFELDDKMMPYAFQQEKWKSQHYPTYREPGAFFGFGTWENALTHGGTSLNLANDVGFLTAMALGLGHEYKAGDFDNLYNRALTAPQGFVNTKMDMWNNFVGAGIGSLPNKLVSYPEKLKLLNWMLQNNMLSVVDDYDTRFRKRRTKIPHPYVEEPIVLPEDWYSEE